MRQDWQNMREVKAKAISVQARTDPEVSRSLRLPKFFRKLARGSDAY
jgi:hypothetical protein